MHFFSIRILIIFCLLAPYWCATGQDLNLTTYSVEDGLQGSAVLSMCQDSTDVMWLGTQNAGLVGFDGKIFQYYDKTAGLEGNNIFSLAMHKGKLYLGTDKGLQWFDGQSVHRVEAAGIDPAWLIYGLESIGDSLLVATNLGLHSLRDTVLSPAFKGSKLEQTQIFKVVRDEVGNLFICTLFEGLWIYQPNEKDGLTQHKFYNAQLENFFGDVCQLKDGTYIAANKTRLYQFTHQGGTEWKFDVVFTEAGFADYYDVHQDRSGQIWVGSDKGIFQFGEDYSYQLYNKHNGLASNSVWKLTEDREGNLWLASNSGGLTKLRDMFVKHFKPAHGLPKAQIHSLCQDVDGGYFIGTSEGLYHFDGHQSQHLTIRDKEVIAGQNVLKVKFHGDSLFACTDYGLYLRYKGIGKWFLKGPIAERGIRKVWDIEVDDQNNVYLATQQGVAKLRNDSIIPLNHEGVVTGWYVFDIANYHGELWFATETGLARLENGEIVDLKADGFPNSRVRVLHVDQEGVLWAGGNQGVFRVDGDRVKNYGQEIGLSDPVFGLDRDSEGRLWVIVPSAIWRYDFEGDSLLRVDKYNKDQGYLAEVPAIHGILRENDDKIWVAHATGIEQIQPSEERHDTIAPYLKVENVRLFYNSIDWSLFDAEWQRGSSLPVEVDFPHYQNHVTLDFLAVSHTMPDLVTYRYQLEGLEQNWVHTPSRSVTYNNLKPGRYQFLVQAQNGEGIWSDNIAHFSFRILPPFYQTWWFYTLCIALVLAAVYSYLTIRRSNIQIKKFNQQVIAQKAVIEEKNHDIMASIQYAERIQAAILPESTVIDSVLKDYFIIFKPRDVVSGDFYWAHALNDKEIFICAADCTGHGVPGAFMSMIGSAMLNKIIVEQQQNEVDEVLNQLREGIVRSLKQRGNVGESKDGMDLALLRIDFWDDQVDYAGANNSLYICRGGEIIEYKANKQPIGYYTQMSPFTKHEVNIQSGDSLYIFSDGFPDQFGGPKNKKFMIGRLKKFLATIAHLPMADQKVALEKALAEWMGEEQQVDDICFIGVKIP